MNCTSISTTSYSPEIIKEHPMAYNKLIACLLVLLFSACQQIDDHTSVIAHTRLIKHVSVLADHLELRPQEGLVYYQNEPFTGLSLDYYPDGTKSTTIEYLGGKRQGIYRKWFENGALSFEANYQSGKRDGTSKTWWSNGNLRTISNHKMGVPHGIQKQWYQSGAKFKHIELNHGIEEGLQQSWRENGKIYNNYEAKNGRIFGLKRANLCYELEEEIIQYKN